MKIIYFNYMYDLLGSSLGSYIKAKELFSALSQGDHEVKIFWRKGKPKQDDDLRFKVRTLLKSKFSRFLHEPKQILINIKYLFAELKIIQKEKPDLLVSRLDMYVFSGLLLAKLKGIPFLLEADCPDVYEKRTFYSQYFRLPGVCEFIEWLNIRFADKMFVVSEESKSYFLRRGIPSKKVEVIPNGANPEKFSPATHCNGVVEKLNLQDKVVIGFVGSFHYWHGIENLKSLITETVQNGDDTVFLMVGDGGPMKFEIHNFVESSELKGKVRFIGFVDYNDMPLYLSVMNIVLAPYPKLDFFYYSPVKVFEYLAAGKALVTSRIGQIAEVIEDGVNGFLYEPDNLDEMIEKVNILIKDDELRDVFGRNARKTVIEKYSWQKHANRLSHICHQLKKKV